MNQSSRFRNIDNIQEKVSNKNEPIILGNAFQESKVYDSLVKINNFPFDTIYFGSSYKISKNKTFKPKSKMLFVSPYIGIASLFVVNHELYSDNSPEGFEITNIDRHEYHTPINKLKSQDKFEYIHATVRGGGYSAPGSISFNPPKGYIYSIDVSKYKDKIYCYPQHEKEGKMFLICDDNIRFDDRLEHTVKEVYVKYIISEKDDIIDEEPLLGMECFIPNTKIFKIIENSQCINVYQGDYFGKLNPEIMIKEEYNMNYPDRFRDNSIYQENTTNDFNTDANKGNIFESGHFKGFGKDVNLEEHNTDPIEIGIDDNDIHNEYDQKDIDTLNELIASEQSAIGEYLDAAKNTNVDILRRLYSDIGDEERFHSEQLMFAKASITGEKYEPRDPEVKKEYEELLAMGMDEETAMTTAIDKTNFMGKDDGDDSDIEELDLDISMIEESFHYFCTNDNLLQTICEYSLDNYNDELSKQLNIFAESALYLEAVDNVLSQKNSRGPISLLFNGIMSIIKFVKNLIYKFKDFVKKILIKHNRMHQWLKNNGIKGIFQNGVYLYFYSPDKGSVKQCITHATNEAINYTDLLYNIIVDIGKKVGFNVSHDNRITINRNIRYSSVEQGIDIINKVVMTKTKIVVTGANEQDLKEVFFGDVNNGVSIYKTLENLAARMNIISNAAEMLVNNMKDLEKNTNSIYYKNKKLYDWGINNMRQVINGFKLYMKALSSDMGQVMKLNKDILEKTHPSKNNNNSKSNNDQSSTNNNGEINQSW